MLDNYTKEQVEKISMEILKRSGALDMFPTPVDTIIRQAKLTVDAHIDLSTVKISFLERLSEGVKNAAKELRGVLDRRHRVIYLDLSVAESKKNFVTLHETGHELLTWQSDIINCLDNDETLNPDIQEQFEAEANFFASTTLFQHDRFDYYAKKLELGISASMALAKKFGSSQHAALRRYVERSARRCALLVLEKPIFFPRFACNVKNYFQSEPFSAEFGELEWDEQLTAGHRFSFMDMYLCRKKFSTLGELTLITDDDLLELNFHYFNNTYNAFILLFPKGEIKPTRTKIVVSGLGS